MERFSLRGAAEKTARSVTTLRRYIRAGRLAAVKLPGRFGPEYFVTDQDLVTAGLDPGAAAPVSSALIAPLRRIPARLPRSMPVVSREASDAGVREVVPVGLFQDLQMKHEQLLVQYGMVRAAGLRVLDMQAELDARRRQIEDAQAETVRAKERLAHEAGDLRKRLREAELELEGRRVETAALREKVRGLEMLTRNAVTNEEIDRQFADVMDQMRRVDRLTADHDRSDLSTAPWPVRAPLPEPEH